MSSWLAVPVEGFASLFGAGDGGVHTFPGAEEIEAPVFLHQLYRLIDSALQLIVVAELDEAGEREVLAQGVTLKAVIGEKSPEVRVAGEQDAVKIVSLSLEPVGRREQPDDARHWVRRIGLGAHADAVVQPRAEQMIDDVEPLLPLGVVDAANVDQAAEAAERIVAQELDDFGDMVARDLDGELAERHLGRQKLRPKAIADI